MQNLIAVALTSVTRYNAVESAAIQVCSRLAWTTSAMQQKTFCNDPVNTGEANWPNV